jgi:hypothetical protein
MPPPAFQHQHQHQPVDDLILMPSPLVQRAGGWAGVMGVNLGVNESTPNDMLS